MEERIYKEGVKFARYVVKSILNGKKLTELIEEAKSKFPDIKQGIFTTIHTYPERQLRGCIGIPEPVYPFYKALVLSAYWAAFEDPRFPPLVSSELEHVIFEVSYLTPPQLLEVNSPFEYLEKIKIGKHGIIVERGPYRGLLLPQVPIEEGWNVEEFLSYCCMKAGLLPDAWLDKETKVYIFEAIIYEEVSPNGEVIKKELIEKS